MPTGASSDTFPRQYARTRRLTLGEPRNITVSPDGRRVVFVRSRGGERSRQLPVGAGSGSRLRGRAPRGRSDRAALRRSDEADLPPAERARRERAREGAGGVVAYATDAAGDGGRLRAVRPPVRGRPRLRCCSRARRGWAGVRPPPRPDRPGGWPTSAVAGSASPSWTAPAASWPAMTTRTSRGDRPSSSPPRRWTVTGATGGRPTARPSSPRGRHLPGRPAGGSATRPPGHAADRARLPGGRHGQRRCDALGARPRRQPARDPTGTAGASRTWSTCSGPSTTGSC